MTREKVVSQAWVENDNKLCIRWNPDEGAETLGMFHPSKHEIIAEAFIGKSATEACDLFNEIVYSELQHGGL